jgi:hypothetical protein
MDAMCLYMSDYVCVCVYDHVCVYMIMCVSVYDYREEGSRVQKRPTIEAKETYYRGKRDLL